MPSLNLTQTYSYDPLDRLTSVQETGSNAPWSENYLYDSFSNRYVDPGQKRRSGLPILSPETPQASSWFQGSNRITDWGYDEAGNVTSVGSMSRTFTYDAENRQVTATINNIRTQYLYDGEGKGVMKLACPDANTCTTATIGVVATVYVYDAAGNLAAEYSPTVVSPCATSRCYVTVDHLVSTRLITDNVGMAKARYDYQPFGTELLAGTGGRTTDMGYSSAPDKSDPTFTGQMRDSETGLDAFAARYMSGAQGRFQSADPGNAGADPTSPQTWNAYNHVGNNPLSITDPSGAGFTDFLYGVIHGALDAFSGGIWGAITAGINGTSPGGGSFGSLPTVGGIMGCGGPLGNYGGIGGDPWNEQSPIGPNVQDPGRFVFDFQSQLTRPQSTGEFIRAYFDTAGFLANFLTGTGPRIRRYGPDDYRTRDFAASMGVQEAVGRIRTACLAGAPTGREFTTTPHGYLHIPYDSLHSPIGGQVGGWVGRWTISGDSLWLSVHNEAGLNSFAYHIPRNSPFQTGPMRTIFQDYTIRMPNPCGAH